MTPATYDPEKALWLPNRRKFFLMGLAAGVASFLPDIAPAKELKLGSWESASWVDLTESRWYSDGTTFTVEVISRFGTPPPYVRCTGVLEDLLNSQYPFIRGEPR